MNELLTLGAFYGVSAGMHVLHEKTNKACPSRRHRFAALATIATHPTVLDTVRDYAVHFVIYSGYVLGH
jgi:hypothetical protein